MRRVGRLPSKKSCLLSCHNSDYIICHCYRAGNVSAFSKVRRLSVEQPQRIHRLLIVQTGGLDGIRDEGLVAAAANALA